MTEPAGDELIAESEHKTSYGYLIGREATLALISRIRKEQEDKAVMARALRKLANDVGGMKAFENAVRDAIGNTNYSLIMLRVEEADAALTGSSTIISDMEAEIERLRSRYDRVKVKFAALCHAVDGLEWEGVLGGHGTMMSAMWSLNAEFDELK